MVKQTPRRGLTEPQCKTWVSNILNSETEVKNDQQDNFLHKLVRGMPVRLRACKATCTDNAASSCSLALPINCAFHCTAIENCIACCMHAHQPSEIQFPNATTFVQNFFPSRSLGICAQRCTQAIGQPCFAVPLLLHGWTADRAHCRNRALLGWLRDCCWMLAAPLQKEDK